MTDDQTAHESGIAMTAGHDASHPADDVYAEDEASAEDEDDTGVGPGADILPPAARRAFATLLTSRFIVRDRNRPVWDSLMLYRCEIEDRLADMYLELLLDTESGVAFKRQTDDEDAPVMLRRERPLSRDASLLLIQLSKEQLYADAVTGPVMVTRTQIVEFLRPFREDGDVDEARLDRRADAAIRALRDLRLVTPDPDADDLYAVSPVVGPLIGPDELIRFEAYFAEAAARASGGAE